MAYQSPYELLQTLVQSAQKDSSTGESRHDGSTYRGLCFQMGSWEFVTSLDSIVEIMGPVSILPMPRVKSWLKGAIQLRGQPILVTDLCDYLLSERTPMDHQNRIVVVEYQNEKVGFLLKNIVKFVRFKETASTALLPQFIHHPYVTEIETVEEKTMPSVDLIRLCQHPNFLNTRRVRKDPRVNHELND